MAIVDGFLTSPTTKSLISLRWLKLEQFKFNQSGAKDGKVSIPISSM